MIEKLKAIDDPKHPWEDEEGCSWESRGSYLQCEVIGLCGCGNPWEVMIYVRDMLQRLRGKDYGDYEDMPYMFFCYWANEMEFAEHGGTVRLSFLTEKGEELLDDINTIIAEEGVE